MNKIKEKKRKEKKRKEKKETQKMKKKVDSAIKLHKIVGRKSTGLKSLFNCSWKKADSAIKLPKNCSNCAYNCSAVNLGPHELSSDSNIVKSSEYT